MCSYLFDSSRFGQIDVEKHRDLATHWGIDTTTLPSITWPLIQSFYNSFPPLWSNWSVNRRME
jgi:hypothetical protein